MPTFDLFATAPRGLEKTLADELRRLGAGAARPRRAGVAFRGDLMLAYRACLWSRVASRILLPLARFPAPTPEALYEGVHAIDWRRHLAAGGTLAVDGTGAAPWLRDSRFGVLKVKDAIVDRLRADTGQRPDVDTECPDLRVNLHLSRGPVAQIALDLSGDSLHRRGYRQRGARAPLKENLAAGLLFLAGWPGVVARGGGLVDPMCGSGTLLIEAAWMAADIAPGLQRDYWGFLGWNQHDDGLWRRLLEEAEQRREQGLEGLPPLRGYDVDARTVETARVNVRRAGLTGRVEVAERAIQVCRPESLDAPGLVMVNPPYGERLQGKREAARLYADLGTALGRCWPGWRAAVLSSDPRHSQRLGLVADRSPRFHNGALECRLLCIDEVPAGRGQALPEADTQGAGARMFANRLRKNLKHLGRWARRQGVSCYRLYDADLPEYAVAIDLYAETATGRVWAHVQEYAPPAGVDGASADRRLAEVMAVVPEVLEIPRQQVVLKIRERGKGGSRYGRLARVGEEIEVEEDGLRFLVNLTDYLDTGLFLDHRLTRRLVREAARDRRFLNLFAYTGSATVHAAAGGARATTSVDMSATYLDWARRNMARNGFDGAEHRYEREDCLAWLETAARRGGPRFDLIFLDPPSFSNSRRMRQDFDVQRDHVRLIELAGRLLDEGGVLFFSNNLRRFRLDREALSGWRIEDLNRKTLPEDFRRNPRIHHAWRLRRD